MFRSTTQTPDHMVRQVCEDIWLQFIPERSESQVNVDCDMVSGMRKKRESGQIDRHFYDEAQQYIFQVQLFIFHFFLD